MTGIPTLWRVPDLPDHYLPRPEALAGLTAALRREDARQVGITGASGTGGRFASRTDGKSGKHALFGMGGLGKSVLAAALCHEPSIQARYPDGILWLAVGETPELLTLQASLARALGDSVAFNDPLDGRRRLRELLADKAVLVILDDVWQSTHVDRLDVTGPRGCLFITTRDRRVLQSGAEHRLEVLTKSQALALLGHWVGQDTKALPKAAAEVAEACGRLPLALATIGAMVRADELNWADARNLLADANLADLEARFPDYPYPSILAAIEVSVHALGEHARARYLDLAIFPEDEPIPEAALEILWGRHRLVAAKLRRLLGTLVARSLATRDQTGALRLHDLQRMYLRQRVGADLERRHGQLVDAYLERCPAGIGHAKDDGYCFQRLPWHISQVGRLDELTDLLFDYDWLAGKLRATSVPALLADFDLLPAEHQSYPDAHLVRDALRLSSHVLADDADQLPSQLIGRLRHFERPPTTPLARLLDRTRGPHSHAWFEPRMASLVPPGGPLLRTLSEHTGRVFAVAVSEDGKRAISASWDQSLKVWDLDDGHLLRTIAGHAGFVYAVAVFRDGKRAISASFDKTLKVWDIVGGSLLRTLSGHTAPVFAVAVFGDGKRAISASADSTLKVWSLESGHLLRTLSGHAGFVYAVAVFGGKRAISASDDNTLTVWDLESGRPLRTLSGHAGFVYAVAVFAGGKRAISASEDNTLKVWNLDDGDQLRTLSGHAAGIRSLAVFRDGKQAISASDDKSLKIWDLDCEHSLRALPEHAAAVLAVAVSENGKEAISAATDGTFKVWDLDNGKLLRTRSVHAKRLRALAVCRDGTRAISAAFDQTLKVWDLDNGKLLHTLSGHAEWVNAIAVFRGNKRAISTSCDKTLKVWDLDNGKLLGTLLGHADEVNGVAVFGDDKRAISTSEDNTLKIWNLDNGKLLGTLSGCAKWVNAVAVFGDDKRALLASGDHTLKIWDINNGHLLGTLSGHAAPICKVAVFRDGKHAITASEDNTLKVWDLDNEACLTTFTTDASIHACAAVGDRIIAGDALGRVHILRLREPRDDHPLLTSNASTAAPRHHAPTTEPPPMTTQQDLDRLAEALAGCAAIRDHQARNRIVERLPGDIQARIHYSPMLRLHVDSIVATCASFPDGLSKLHRAVHYIEGDTIPMRSVDAVLASIGITPAS